MKNKVFLIILVAMGGFSFALWSMNNQDYSIEESRLLQHFNAGIAALTRSDVNDSLNNFKMVVASKLGQTYTWNDLVLQIEAAEKIVQTYQTMLNATQGQEEQSLQKIDKYAQILLQKYEDAFEITKRKGDDGHAMKLAQTLIDIFKNNGKYTSISGIKYCIPFNIKPVIIMPKKAYYQDFLDSLKESVGQISFDNQYNLAIKYTKGNGVEPDLDRALMHIELALEVAQDTQQEKAAALQREIKARRLLKQALLNFASETDAVNDRHAKEFHDMGMQLLLWAHQFAENLYAVEYELAKKYLDDGNKEQAKIYFEKALKLATTVKHREDLNKIAQEISKKAQQRPTPMQRIFGTSKQPSRVSLNPGMGQLNFDQLQGGSASNARSSNANPFGLSLFFGKDKDK